MKTRIDAGRGFAQDAAYKPIRMSDDTLEKSIKQLPTEPKLDYNPFVQQQKQGNGSTPTTSQSGKSGK
jgi:hypothetical protein